MQLVRFVGDISHLLRLRFGCALAMHVLLPNGLQNRRCAEQYGLHGAGEGLLKIGATQFPSVREVLQEVGGDEISNLNSLGFRSPLILELAEKTPHMFERDDQIGAIEGQGREGQEEVHRFVYMVYQSCMAYADTLETIICSRRHVMGG